MRHLMFLIVICLLFGCGGGDDMKVIKPIEFNLDASTIDIDSDGYEEWETGTAYPDTLFVGTNNGFYAYEHDGDNLTLIANLVEQPPSSPFGVNYIRRSAFTPDYKYLFFGAFRAGRIYILERSPSGVSILSTLNADLSSSISGLSYFPPYLVAASGGEKGFAWYKFENGTVTSLSSPVLYNRKWRNNIVWIDKDVCLLASQSDRDLYITAFLRTGNTLSPFSLFQSDNEVTALGLTGDAETIIAAGGYTNPRINLYKYDQDEQTAELVYSETGTADQVHGLSFSPDGEILAVGGYVYGTTPVGYLDIYSIGADDTYSKLTSPATEPSRGCNALAWSLDSQYLFTSQGNDSPYLLMYKRSGDALALLTTYIDTAPSETVQALIYAPETGYFEGNIIRRGNNLYESLINDNQNNDPATEVSTSPTWLHLGKVNKHRMFDDKLSTLSVQPGTTGQSFTLFLDSATEGFFTLTYIEEYEWKYGTAFSAVSENIQTFSFPHDVSAATIQSTLEAVYGKGLVTVTAATDFTIAFDAVIGDSRLHLGTYDLGVATPTLTESVAFVPLNLVVTLTPLEAGSDHVYLFGLDATAVTVQHYESNGTTQVSTSGAIDVTDKKSTSRALTRAMTANEKITITIANTATTAKCGKVIIGESVMNKVKAQWGITPEVKSYGRRNFDDFGQAYLKRGNVAKKVKASCILDSDADTDEIFEVLNEIDNIPAVYDFNSTTTTYSTLHVYGIYLDARMPFQGLNYTKLQLDILGLI